MGMSSKEVEDAIASDARFVIMSREAAVKIGALPPGDDDWGWVVVERADGKVRVVGEDGGEPEDQVLPRDWRWVAPALNEAFEAGKRAAAANSAPTPQPVDDEKGRER